MSNGLKQRVVGVLVLASLGLILLPILFDFADPKLIDRTSLIPPAPEIITQNIPQTSRPLAASEKPSAALFDNALENTATEQKEKDFGLNQSGLPISWALQIGTYAEQSNANEMMQSLRAKNFKAYQRTVQRGDQTLYKVCIGPKLDRRRVLADKEIIDKLLAIDSLVIEYEH